MQFIDKNKILFILCFVFAVFLINQKYFSFSFIENYIVDFSKPAVKAGSSVANYVSIINKNLYNLFQIYQDNQFLRERNSKLEKYYYLNQQLEEENDLLKQQLNYLKNSVFDFVTVPVIGRTNGTNSRTLIIDAGFKQNIRIGQIVIYEKQLVGRVIKVNKNSSRVLLLTDPLSGIPVKGLESGVKFIANGQFTNLLLCKYLREENLQNGELVVTTNDNASIIANIIVGKVVNKENNYYVQPNIDFNQIDMVQIISNDKSQ